MFSKHLFSSKDHTWATPWDIFEKIDAIFNFNIDPCATEETAKCRNFFTIQEDGLTKDWSAYGNAFVNPPFGRELPKWMEKCWRESLKGINVVMLIPARVDTRYWHNYAFKYASCICFVKGRISFVKQGIHTSNSKCVSAPFPNAIVIFGKCTKEQMHQLRYFGFVISMKPISSQNELKGLLGCLS